VNPKAIEREGRVVPSVDASERVATIPESGDMMDRIVNLNHQLRIQLRLLDAYMSHLGEVLEEEDVTESEERLLSLSDQVIRHFFSITQIMIAEFYFYSKEHHFILLFVDYHPWWL